MSHPLFQSVVQCMDCLYVLPWTEDRHNGAERCPCGGDLSPDCLHDVFECEVLGCCMEDFDEYPPVIACCRDGECYASFRATSEQPCWGKSSAIDEEYTYDDHWWIHACEGHEADYPNGGWEAPSA